MSLTTLEALKADGKLLVITFVGYSRASYQDPYEVQTLITRILDKFKPERHLINCRATAEGIGVVYEIAKAKGFETIGIESSLAATEGRKLSPYVDTVCFISDETWGGYLPNGELSPTSAAIVDISDIMIGIGGGEIARDELRAAEAADKLVYYIKADLNNLNLNDYVGHDVEITLRNWDKHQCILKRNPSREYPFV